MTLIFKASREFSSSIESVWKWITDPAPMRQWYFPQLLDFRAQKGFQTTFDVTHNGKTYPHIWTVVKADEPRLLSYEWQYGGFPGKGLVTFTIDPPAILQLEFHVLDSFQSDKNPEMSDQNFIDGWTELLDNLQNYALNPNSMEDRIHVRTTVNAGVEKTWELWTDPQHIVNWCQASPEWHAPESENDLREGGHFRTRMAAKDGSVAFDFEGNYDTIRLYRLIEYTIADGRKVRIEFIPTGNTTTIEQHFEAENEHPKEMQREGWQSILNSFKGYVAEH